ncbi:MAG: glycosyltransferase family 2 protein [Sphaerobacteraceae bacterium]|nr:MAG: glycosyltransferase family 2 protein [Sphaerobacteraceae bacterium]
MDLSIIIPAYNEEDRLPSTVRESRAFLDSLEITWELLIADDGSTDRTAELASEAESEDARVRHLRLPHGGKAQAVRAGVRAANGRHILFTDADLATPIIYVSDAFDLLEAGWDVVIGSREGTGSERQGEPLHRHWMGRLYNYVVQGVLLPGIKDTQCGFKGFRRPVAEDLFSSSVLYPDGGREVKGPLVTGFDVELLFIARKRGYSISELPVVWKHVAGSKVRPGIDGLLMLKDVFQVRWNDIRGRYASRS